MSRHVYLESVGFHLSLEKTAVEDSPENRRIVTCEVLMNEEIPPVFAFSDFKSERSRG